MNLTQLFTIKFACLSITSNALESRNSNQACDPLSTAGTAACRTVALDCLVAVGVQRAMDPRRTLCQPDSWIRPGRIALVLASRDALSTGAEYPECRLWMEANCSNTLIGPQFVVALYLDHVLVKVLYFGHSEHGLLMKMCPFVTSSWCKKIIAD